MLTVPSLKAPHNLKDQDFGIHTKVLPPSRPEEEFTPSAYLNAKLSICKAFSDAAELSHATIPPSYDEVIAADSSLEDARAALPPPLRSKAFDINITDTPQSIMCCISLDLLYQKTKCVLHRRFMSAESYSREGCLKSAMQMLQHHEFMVVASQEGGQLEIMAWYIDGWAKSDFVLAATILCVELSQQNSGSRASIDPAGEISVSREDMIGALERTEAIWEEKIRQTQTAPNQALKRYSLLDKSVMQETVKACKAIRTMLQLVKARHTGTAAVDQRPDQIHQQAAGQPFNFETMGDYSASSQQSALPIEAGSDDYAMMAGMMDGFDNINWVR